MIKLNGEKKKNNFCIYIKIKKKIKILRQNKIRKVKKVKIKYT